MRAAVAAINLVLGSVYLILGILVLIDLVKGLRTLGFSHFGAGIVGLAFTCGAHHAAHGIHVGFEGRQPELLDLLVVAFGLPAGAAWAYLRIEAFRGGRGDRFIRGTPAWLSVTPTMAAMYLTAFGAALVWVADRGVSFRSYMVPNILLVGIYMTIGYYLLRTQLQNRAPLGGWSLSGLSLMGIFPTCALMHGVTVASMSTRVYTFDPHGFTIDWLSVPAGLYFLWAVWALYRDALVDWNRAQEAKPDVALAV